MNMREIKLKERSQDKFDAILTGIVTTEPHETLAAINNILSWKCGAMIYTSTDVRVVEGHIRTETPRIISRPTLKEVVGQIMMQTMGNKIIAICDADTQLGDNAEALFKQVDTAKMQLAWGAFAGVPWPKLFIMSGQVLPYFWRTIPNDLKFAGDEWKSWMHNSLGSLLQSHRYFNANPYGIVKEPVEVVPSPVAEVSAPVDTQVPAKPKKPVKRRKSKK